LAKINSEGVVDRAGNGYGAGINGAENRYGLVLS